MGSSMIDYAELVKRLLAVEDASDSLVADDLIIEAADAIKAQADEIFRLKAAIYACLPSGMSEYVFEEAYK